MPSIHDYAQGLTRYHGRDEGEDIARHMLASQEAAFRVHVQTRHESHDGAYWADRVDLVVQMPEWDASSIMLTSVVASIGPMLAGDMIRLEVTRLEPNREDRVTYRYEGQPTRTTFNNINDRELTDGNAD